MSINQCSGEGARRTEDGVGGRSLEGGRAEDEPGLGATREAGSCCFACLSCWQVFSSPCLFSSSFFFFFGLLFVCIYFALCFTRIQQAWTVSVFQPVLMPPVLFRSTGENRGSRRGKAVAAAASVAANSGDTR